jgi:hypothetical protein
LKPHPLLSVFPEMNDAEFAAFLEDIRTNGVREPAWTWRGWLIDGRHRDRACQRLKIKLPTREWDGKESELLAFVVSMNLRRRHLDESQRAMVGAKLASLGEGRPKITSSIELVSQMAAAEMLNISVASIKRAKTVIENGAPELVQAVESGRVAVSAAAELAYMPEDRQRAILSTAEEAEREHRPPRQADDPDRHIRCVKGKYQARPIDLGERYDLGLFPTKAAARKAIEEFWWGKRSSLPKFVKKVHSAQGEHYIALVFWSAGNQRVGEEYATPDAAGRAAERWVRANFGKEMAERIMKRLG